MLVHLFCLLVFESNSNFKFNFNFQNLFFSPFLFPSLGLHPSPSFLPAQTPPSLAAQHHQHHRPLHFFFRRPSFPPRLAHLSFPLWPAKQRWPAPFRRSDGWDPPVIPVLRLYPVGTSFPDR